MDRNTTSGLTIKWLGLSGVELRCGGSTLLVDPVFTRLSLSRAAVRRVRTDEHVVRSRLNGCNGMLITHAHHDHMMDAPLICRLTGAPMHGSPNACAIALACGAPGDRLNVVRPGSAITAGPFSVTALPATHIRLPGFGDGPVRSKLRPPLRMRQYRMDGSMVFLVEAGGCRLLVGPGLCLENPGAVDGLLFSPVYCAEARMREYLTRLRPRFLLPIHWEGIFPAEGRPLRPALAPGFPPRRYDMGRVKETARELGIRYAEPVVDREYWVEELMLAHS